MSQDLSQEDELKTGYDGLYNNRGKFAEIVGQPGNRAKIRTDTEGRLYIGQTPIEVDHCLKLWKYGLDEDPLLVWVNRL